MTPKLVASDLDGTLVRSDGTVSPRTAAAVARVEDAGVPLVLVTGRPPRWMAEIADALGHHGLAVCANGALVYDLHTETVVHEQLLEADALRQVTDALREELPEVVFAVDYGATFAYESGYEVRRTGEARQVSAVDFAELLSMPAAKLLARHPSLSPDEFLAAARRILGETASLTHASRDALLEISAAGVTKATGLALLAEERGVDAAAVAAFGDMPNDLPMLAWAGQSYAVANAHPDVIDAADEIVPANDDDGVAQVLERWF